MTRACVHVQGTAKDAWLFGKVQLSKLSMGLDSARRSRSRASRLQVPGRGRHVHDPVGLSGDGCGPSRRSPSSICRRAAEQADRRGHLPPAPRRRLQALRGRKAPAARSPPTPGSRRSQRRSGHPSRASPPRWTARDLSLCHPTASRSRAPARSSRSRSSATAKYIWSQGRFELSGNLTLKGAGFELSAAIDNAFSMPSRTSNVHATGELKGPLWTGGVLRRQGRGRHLDERPGRLRRQAGTTLRLGRGRWGEISTRSTTTATSAPTAPAAPLSTPSATWDGSSGCRQSQIELVTLHGVGGPPPVSLTGPAGQRFDTPADGSPLRTPGAFIGRDPTTATTYAILFAPAAGMWTIVPEAGAAAPTSVQVADGLPPARVNARVRRAHKRFVLSWRLRRIAGQRDIPRAQPRVPTAYCGRPHGRRACCTSPQRPAPAARDRSSPSYANEPGSRAAG